MLFGLCFFGLLFGRTVIYLWDNQSISVGKSCGGGFKEWVIGCLWFWLYLSHSHCSLVSVMVRMNASVWSYMLASVPCICIVGLSVMISLSGLHSLVLSVRFVAMMGGRTNLRSWDCEKFIHGLYAARVLALS